LVFDFELRDSEGASSLITITTSFQPARRFASRMHDRYNFCTGRRSRCLYCVPTFRREKKASPLPSEGKRERFLRFRLFPLSPPFQTYVNLAFFSSSCLKIISSARNPSKAHIDVEKISGERKASSRGLFSFSSSSFSSSKVKTHRPPFFPSSLQLHPSTTSLHPPTPPHYYTTTMSGRGKVGLPSLSLLPPPLRLPLRLISS